MIMTAKPITMMMTMPIMERTHRCHRQESLYRYLQAVAAPVWIPTRMGCLRPEDDLLEEEEEEVNKTTPLLAAVADDGSFLHNSSRDDPPLIAIFLKIV